MRQYDGARVPYPTRERWLISFFTTCLKQECNRRNMSHCYSDLLHGEARGAGNLETET